jgi:hypothetical protein
VSGDVESHLSEPLYDLKSNEMPAVSQRLLSNDEAGLPRFPVFIEKDFVKSTQYLKSYIKISLKL